MLQDEPNDPLKVYLISISSFLYLQQFRPLPITQLRPWENFHVRYSLKTKKNFVIYLNIKPTSIYSFSIKMWLKKSFIKPSFMNNKISFRDVFLNFSQGDIPQLFCLTALETLLSFSNKIWKKITSGVKSKKLFLRVVKRKFSTAIIRISGNKREDFKKA